MKGLFTRGALIIMSSLALSACEDKKTYSYLVQHPLVLKKAYDACQTEPQDTSAAKADCEVVMSAANYVSAIINDVQVDPERFGERILDEEANLANKKAAALAACKESATSLSCDQAKKAYDDLREEVSVLLAVLGMNTPE